MEGGWMRDGKYTRKESGGAGDLIYRNEHRNN